MKNDVYKLMTQKGYVIPVCYTNGLLTFPKREDVMKVFDLRPSELKEWIDKLPDYRESKKGDI